MRWVGISNKWKGQLICLNHLLLNMYYIFELHQLLLVFYVNFCLLFKNFVRLAKFLLNYCLKVFNAVQWKLLRSYPSDLFIQIDNFSRFFWAPNQLRNLIQLSFLWWLSAFKLDVHAWCLRSNVSVFFLLKFLIPLLL